MKKRTKKQKLHCPECTKILTSSRGLAVHMAWHKRASSNKLTTIPTTVTQPTNVAISITKDAVIINTRLV